MSKNVAEMQVKYARETFEKILNNKKVKISLYLISDYFTIIELSNLIMLYFGFQNEDYSSKLKADFINEQLEEPAYSFLIDHDCSLPLEVFQKSIMVVDVDGEKCQIDYGGIHSPANNKIVDRQCFIVEALDAEF